MVNGTPFVLVYGVLHSNFLVFWSCDWGDTRVAGRKPHIHRSVILRGWWEVKDTRWMGCRNPCGLAIHKGPLPWVQSKFLFSSTVQSSSTALEIPALQPTLVKAQCQHFRNTLLSLVFFFMSGNFEENFWDTIFGWCTKMVQARYKACFTCW